jgi:hypothetical protein
MGGVGFPTLYWFDATPDYVTMVTDAFGESLQDVFDRAGRYFEMPLVLEIASQMLSRLEWMHSRQITHGNLSPSSFAIGGSSWQTPQIILAGFENADMNGKSAYEDLHAVGDIMIYFATGFKSWIEFQKCKRVDVQIPQVLQEYLALLMGPDFNPADYTALRRHFHKARHCLAKRAVIGGLESSVDHSPSLKTLAQKTTGDLFEDLGSKLLAIGVVFERAKESWTVGLAKNALACLAEVMSIYTVLLMRDKPSRKRKGYMLGAYHLPNRVLRDLRWFIGAAKFGPLSFQQVAVLAIYKYMGVLHEVIPLYNKYWTSFMSDLAYAQLGLNLRCSHIWRRNWSYWKDCANFFSRK